MAQAKITEKTKLRDILKIKGAEEILVKHNLPCLHCPMAAYEIDSLEIGNIAETYSLNIKKLLTDLNKIRK